LGKRFIRTFGSLAFFLFASVAMGIAAPPSFDAEAVRLNNRGAAEMSQQFTERAQATFAEAFQRDPKLAQAAINEGIALMALQKLDEAKKALQAALALNPESAQAWYNLGLAQHAGNELAPALASFQQAAKIDPRDADSLYFVGVCYQELKQFDKAIDSLRKALEIDPLHASSEFALARALQRTGHVDEAKEHFKRFQHLTSTKIGAPIGLSYGEQGHYSTVTPIQTPEAGKRAMLPVKLVAQPMLSQVRKSGPGPPGLKWTTTGGACMMDVTGAGAMDLVLMQSGPQAIRVLHNTGNGSYEEFDAAAAGL